MMKGRTISPGKVKGVALVSKDPIGFYGGIDIKTGIVIEKGHSLEGKCVKDKILVFPCGKGISYFHPKICGEFPYFTGRMSNFDVPI